jgi:hypothetical protein
MIPEDPRNFLTGELLKELGREVPAQVLSGGVVTPAEIVRNSHLVDRRYNHALGIPTEWLKIRGSFGVLDDLHREQQTRKQDQLHVDDVPTIGPHLFDFFPLCLDTTIKSLSGKGLQDVKLLRGWSLTFGHLAQVLLYEAVLQQKSYFFVTHLARAGFPHEISQAMLQEFINLRRVYEASNHLFTSQAKAKYSIANPLGFGVAAIGNKLHSYITQVFAPYGEINIHALSVPNVPPNSPHQTYLFHYDFEPSEHFSRTFIRV